MTFPTTEVSGILKRSGMVTLDSNGNGVISLSPQNSRQRWIVTGVFVTTNQGQTAIPVPIATVSLNGVHFGRSIAISPGASISASWSGNQDTFTGNLDVGPCDQLQIIFQSGIPATIGYANVRGQYFTRTA